MWTQSTSVTDGRTDRITITKTVHGKNCGIFRQKSCEIREFC